MENKFFLFFIALLLMISIYGCSIINETTKSNIFVEKGVWYNVKFKAFQFENPEYFNNFLVKVENSFSHIGSEDSLLMAYEYFEKKYGHKSLRARIEKIENDYFSRGTWTEKNDPDNHFIQDDIFRLILNEHVEIIVNNEVVTLLDECKLIKISISNADRLLEVRKLNFEEKSKFQNPDVLSYCELEIPVDKPSDRIAKEAGDCCDKNDRHTYKYHLYGTDRKMKAVFWQKNIDIFSYNRVGGKTKNYRKKINGNWVKEKADKIYVYYGGLLYFQNTEGEKCIREEPFGTFGETKLNKSHISHSWPLGAVFWSKKGSLVSSHYAEDNEAVGVVSLCLTTDCEGCEVLTGGNAPNDGEWIAALSSNNWNWTTLGSSVFTLADLSIGVNRMNVHPWIKYNSVLKRVQIDFDGDGKTDILRTN